MNSQEVPIKPGAVQVRNKGISDFEGNQQQKKQFSGHATPCMVSHYNHQIEVAKTVEKPLEEQVQQDSK